MDSLFAKTILLIASLFTVLTGTDYIKISSDSLTYDFKNGGQAPIYYYLNAENIGIKKVRFDVTSFSDWVSTYKEGDHPTAKTSIELDQTAQLNFVLEIHPERLQDGVNKAKVTVEAVDLQDYSILELKEVSITVNKNFKPAPEISTTTTATPEISQLQTATPEPTPFLSPEPVLTAKPLFKTVSPSPKSSQTKIPSPAFSPEPEVPASVLKQFQSVIDSIKLFLKRLF